MYQEAKVKSQKSRTERGRTALLDREKSLRQKNTGKIKRVVVNNLIGDGTHEGVPKNAQEYYDMMIKKGGKITMEEAEYTARTIKDWTAGNYATIRKLQLQNRPSIEADDINNFIKNSTPYKGDIYRGITFESTEEAMRQLSKSDILEQETHSSWSSSEKIAREFAYARSPKEQSVLIETVNKTGASVKNLAAFADELEVIVPKGARHKILNIIKEADFIVVKTIEIVK